MAGDTTDWRDLREFRGVDLEASYVLGWKVKEGALVVEVDLCLAPEHPFYEPPRPSEKACIRPAVIEFPGCTQVAVAGSPAAGSPAEAASRLDLGRIGGFARVGEGGYRLTGRFGTVDIRADRPLLRLRTLPG